MCLPTGDSCSRWFSLSCGLWAGKHTGASESLEQGQALVKLKLCLCSAWEEDGQVSIPSCGSEARLRWRKAWH